MDQTPLDEDGQPPIAIGWGRLRNSRTDELIGLCRGMLADGSLVVDEVKYLQRWLQNNEPVRLTSYGRQLFSAVNVALTDDQLTHEEEDELIHLLLAFTGDGLDGGASVGATRLPLNVPAPQIFFLNMAFCFTGKFQLGTRNECEACVTARSGHIHKSPTLATNFLVVGDLGSVQWLHSNSGRKIEKAVKYRESGREIKIVDETTFNAALTSI